MKAVVLAGGYGTRLRPLTYTCPKPLLPLAGKPILQHIVESLAGHGFDEIFITTNYLRERIEKYFGDGSKYGVKLVYPKEDKALGTAGSVKNVEKHLDDTFAVIQGDNITDVDFKKVLDFHREKKGIATIVLVPVENPSAFGIADVDRNFKVVRFLEKPKPEEYFSNLANTGIYILEPQILDYIPKGSTYDFSTGLFPETLKLGKEIYGCKVNCFWADVGSPESLFKANRWILGKLEKSKIAKTAQIKGDVRGPVLVGEDAVIEAGAKIIGPAIIGDSCLVKANSIIGANSVLEPEVTVGERSRLTGPIIYEETVSDSASKLNECIVGENCRIGSSARLGRHVIVGANCKLGDNVRVQSGAKIWPGIEVDANSVIRGVLRRSMEF